MKVYASLAKLYIQSFYNLPGKKIPGAKSSPKEIAKLAGIVVLALVLVADFGFLFIMVNLNLYSGLVLAGMQNLLILNAAVMATMITLVIGFMMTLSTYYLNDMELQLLAMPIQPRALLGAKFTAVYLSEAVFSLFITGATMVIFGIKESPGPLFYLWGTLAGLLLPLPPLALSYLLQIPLLSFARFLKNKKTIMMVGGILGLVMALGFNVYFQSMMRPASDPLARAAMVAGPDSIISGFGRAYPPVKLAWQAMARSEGLPGLIAMLKLGLFCVAGPALVVWLLSGAYARSLVGFNESHIKKLSRTGADAFIGKRLRSSNVFITLLRREVSLMNREPMYLLNGPFVIILMPLIIGVMFVVQKDALLGDGGMAGVAVLVQGGFGAAVAGLAGAFLGSSTSIACTAVSRDAKALPFIKSLPVWPGLYMLAKLGHAMLFGILGSLLGVGLIGWMLKLGLVDTLAALAVSLALSSLLNLAGLWLDVANPRLSWDNPIAAMKQNPNAVISILASMGLMAGAGYLSFRFSVGVGAFALYFGALPALAFALLVWPCLSFAERRLAVMEA